MTKDKYQEYKRIIKNTCIPFPISDEDQEQKMQPLNDWIVRNTPAKLYKFRACNDNNINAFLNEQIWFSTAAKMNDDFDGMLYCDNKRIQDDFNNQFDDKGNLKIFTFIQSGGKVPEFLIQQLGEQQVKVAIQQILEASNEILHDFSVKLKRFLSDRFNAQYPFISEEVQKVIKFTSFSENISSPQMWGHYAADSTGFALSYDFRNRNYNQCPQCEKLNVSCFAPKLCSLYPIVYEDMLLDSTDFARYLMQYSITRTLVNSFNIPKHEQEKITSTVACDDTFMQTKILTHKSTEWSLEKEWRMIVSYNSPYYAYDQLANIRKKPSALYLGRRISRANELFLRIIAHKQKIPVYKMTIDKQSLEYSLHPVRQSNTRKDLL